MFPEALVAKKRHAGRTQIGLGERDGLVCVFTGPCVRTRGAVEELCRDAAGLCASGCGEELAMFLIP